MYDDPSAGRGEPHPGERAVRPRDSGTARPHPPDAPARHQPGGEAASHAQLQVEKAALCPGQRTSLGLRNVSVNEQGAGQKLSRQTNRALIIKYYSG